MSQNPEDPENVPGTQEDSSSQQNETLVAQIKEVLKNSEQTGVTQDKLDEYMNTLLKAKAKKTRLKKTDSVDSSVGNESTPSRSTDPSKKARIDLFRQQFAENKAKLAERGKNQKGIEEIVTQLQAELNDSQQLISPLNLSFVEPKAIDYNASTSQEELYNILINKEKRITDLMGKVQKLEGNVLDLQENLKEKDSVLDARTKAISLMTESLTKKGKSTLDSLEDTKEQMRKMQENFVKLEEEMKNRQLKLLDDLRSKNREISDLQETISDSSFQNTQLLQEIEQLKQDKAENKSVDDLEVLLEQKKKESTQYLEKIEQLQKQFEESKPSKNEEDLQQKVEKLTKQLDESNKTMIKSTALLKKKLKESNKKIETFKKASDTNALVVQLQDTIAKLNEKVAVLEEEKGNIQLNIVESEEQNTKENESVKQIEELQKTIATFEEEMVEKSKVIDILENELLRVKSEAETRNENTSPTSDFENVTVSKEMSSIQLEEQVDKLEKENEELKTQNNVLKTENSTLQEKIEDLKKQKQEISSKLDNYIQENMDLIDKLEKLSAEKVSSAESIEIVEGLTQQEKLELAAYQKNVELPHDSLKIEDPDPAAELSHMGEDSTELLQRIDMFTIERREVMEKLENLREENNHLSLKIKEIENNRDVLAEAYEQLQNEKEKLDDEIAALKNINNKADNEKQFDDLQQQYNSLLEKYGNVKKNLKENNEMIQEKYVLKSEFESVKEKIVELERKVEEDLEQITNYQLVIEENKNELINSSLSLNEFNKKLEEKENEIQDLTKIMNDLNGMVLNLEAENSKLASFSLMEAQLDNVKKQYEQDVQQIHVEQEKWEEIESELESKKIEVNNLNGILDNKNKIIENLELACRDKDEQFHKLQAELEARCMNLQHQVSNNSKSLEKQIEELTEKNKEQLEKMRKIAANLKKKSQAFTELEKQYKNEKEKWETEIQEKDNIVKFSTTKVDVMYNQVMELESELNSKNINIEQLEKHISLLRDKLEELENNNVQLQNTILELNLKKDKHQEVNLMQELSESTHEAFGYTEEDSGEAKIKELEMYIETQQSDLLHHQERINKLEENVQLLEEAKIELEKVNFELNEKISKNQTELEDKLQSFADLENKFIELNQSYENSLITLKGISEENKDLMVNNQELTELNKKLNSKIHNAQDKVNELSTLERNMEELENTNAALKLQIASLESTHKHLLNENENLVQQSKVEMEKIEGDFQQQLEELVKSRNEMVISCEKLSEQLNEEQLTNFEQELEDYKKLDENNKEEILRLTNELSEATNLHKQASDEIAKLNEKLAELQQELVTKTAAQAVENILSTAERRLSEQTEVNNCTEDSKAKEPTPPTFNWSSVSNSIQDSVEWFNQAFSQPQEAIPQPQQVILQPQEATPQPPSDENTKEELLKKIKTLEFMLYNMEEDKNDTLLQCHEMSNELTRLVYERENNYQIQSSNKTDVESQILLEDAPDNKQSLHSIEFTPVNTSGIEEVVQAKQAYQCFQPETSDGLMSVESQILQESDVQSIPKDLHEIEFTKTHIPEGVVEEKDAYLCYKGDASVVQASFGENDDGWGWGPEEGKLEEEHLHMAQNAPGSIAFKNQLDELTTKVNSMEVERSQHLEQINQLQQKISKLVKKCKELKQKSQVPQSTVKPQEAGDLNDFILDELKSQIATLEAKIQEVNSELNKERTEKAVLAKKAETLTLSNSRILEDKEKQSLEIVNLQRQHQEAIKKLQQQVQWDNSEFDEVSSEPKVPQDNTLTDEELNKKIEELNQIIKDISVDNDKLQTLLEEEHKIRLELESKSGAASEQQQELILLKGRYEELTQTNQELQSTLNSHNLIVDELKTHITAIENRQINLEECQDYVKLLEEKQMIEENFAMTEKKLSQLQFDFELLQSNLNETFQNCIAKDEQINVLQAQLKSFADNNQKLAQLENELQQALKEKEENKDLLQNTIEKLQNELKELNNELEQQKQSYQFQEIQLNNVNQQLEQLQKELEEKDHSFELKLSQTIEELARSWQIQVDQRGIDVAESWKLHLEKVESEFSNNQLKLQKEVEEFEEKYNSLVNENNELRKNVDAEIKSEVSAHQQAANISKSLHDKQIEVDFLTSKVSMLENQIQQLQTKLHEQDSKLNSVDLIIETTQQQFDEKRELVEEFVKVLERNTSEPISYENQKILAEFERQLGLAGSNAELESQINELKSQIDEYKILTENKQQELLRLQQEFATLNSTLLASGKSHNELYEAYEHLQKDLQEKTDFITDLNQQLLSVKDNKESVKIEKELEQLKQDYAGLQQSLTDTQQQLVSVNQYYQEKCSELETVNEELQSVRLSLQSEESQCASLRNQLTEKEQEYYNSVENISHNAQQWQIEYEKLQELLQATEQQYNQSLEEMKTQEYNRVSEQQDVLSNKEKVIVEANLQITQLNERLQEFAEHHQACNNLSLNLQEKMALCDGLEQKLLEQNHIIEENNKQITQLQEQVAIQFNQIEELKAELFAKSNDYDSLIAELDINKSAERRQMPPVDSLVKQTLSEEDIANPVSQAEHDIALYMLHQRDVRCEELTVELTQLLEERDTLQLRLSNAIREKEALVRNLFHKPQISSSNPAINVVASEEPSEAAAASPPTETELNLATKLSELKTIGYKKDKTLVDEQEKRRYQQINIMQQHINEASKLPAEAAAKLVEASSYTLSRDVQSPSKVLLDWFWGRSTPKQGES